VLEEGKQRKKLSPFIILEAKFTSEEQEDKRNRNGKKKYFILKK
tara:strand:- start:225 stop:356 length:132 start_codon:yes stop_codon:yes gene_type:complete